MTEDQLAAIGAEVKSDRLDVTEREAFQAYADAVNEHFGTVNQIYNNAGIAFTGDVEACQGRRPTTRPSSPCAASPRRCGRR